MQISCSYFLFIPDLYPVIVSFGNVTPEQREEAEKNGISIYQWNDFLLLVWPIL